MANVSVSLLGGFVADVDGVPVPDSAWRLKKARELVKLLALAPGNRLHREQAMDALWRDRAPAAAANNLHQAVFVARRALDPDVIEVREEMLRLAADVDVDRLESAAADARRVRTPGAYRAALALNGGELLPENRYDDWAVERREELATLAAELHEELAALGGETADAGRRPALPADASSFVGRGRELGELGALLRGTRLLTLAGTGGVGKTRLSLELARAAEHAYADGVAFAGLATLAGPRLIPEAIAAALDVRALAGDELLAAVAEFLSGRMFLLVLDNCEHLLSELAATADMLLRRAPGLTIIATSREPLRIPGEVVFRVPSLEIPNPELTFNADGLLEYEGVRLFVDRARAASPGFALDADSALDVARICYRLDGLPLALELAAGRVGALAPAAIAERLDNRFHLLRKAGNASPTRQQTLTATLQWSHDLLDDEERTLFRRLAAFSGAFGLAAAETVCADRELGADSIADTLARLVEKSLVTAEDGGARYRLLETVRMYARERLADAGEARELIRRHAYWGLALAEAERGSARLDRDAANLDAAFDALLELAPEDSLRLTVALLPFWIRRIDLNRARRCLELALSAAPHPSALRAEAMLAASAVDLRSGLISEGLARARDSYGLAREVGDARARWQALQSLGEYGLAHDAAEAAVPLLERALELAHREKFAAAAATGVYSLGIARWMLGDLARGEQLLALSAEHFRVLAGSPERISSPVNFAETSRPAGSAGLRLIFEDTVKPFVEISCDAAVGYVLANQAGIARARGDLARARALLDESAARFEELGDELGSAAVLVRRGYLELAEGALPAARSALERALALRRGQRDRRGHGLVLAGLGLIDTIAGRHHDSERELAEAYELFRRAGDRWGLASVLWRIADLAFARGRLDDAEAALLEARAVLRPTCRERWIANTLAGLAEVARARGDTARARSLLLDARDRYAARHDVLGVADSERRLAGIAKDLLSPVKEPVLTTLRTS